jgi:hypothetical protein
MNSPYTKQPISSSFFDQIEHFFVALEALDGRLQMFFQQQQKRNNV